ncbi:MAG: type VI secretion system contractile sheath domain-containing protein [Pikeienuella sp.]
MSETNTDISSGGASLDFGTLSVPPAVGGVSEPRQKFRIAVLGDFSGRANRGELELGADLANRKPMKLDVDTIEDLITRFRTQLRLEIGAAGGAVDVELGTLDDLHPDELYDTVDAFQELQNLRMMVSRGRADAVLDELRALGAELGGRASAPRRRAKGAQVPADRRLSDFAALIGAGPEARPEASTADELIRQVVAPYVVKAPDPDIPAMTDAVDAALSGLMRGVLHHPDFQAVESAWRSLDLLARRIETGGGLELVVYDVAAEELAIDLAVSEDLAQSGLFQMLAEKPALDANQGGLSLVVGLYQFEETPPHAELLGRMAKIAAYMDAPFVSAVSAGAFDTKTDDLAPIVKDAFAALKALPEAAYLGLAVPRFMLRLPYGTRTDPIDPFEFEEFTRAEGLKGMLWANPAVLVAVLVGASWTQGGGKVELGKVMSLDDVPYHFITDAEGDQLALPCTERLLTERSAAEAALRGFMPVLSIAGRNEIRLGSFRSVTGARLAGPWEANAVGGPDAMRARAEAAAVPAVGGAVAPTAEEVAPAAPAVEQSQEAQDLAAADEDLDALLAGLETADEAAVETAPDPAEEASDTDDLDALLASLDAPAPDAEAPPTADELDALLAGLEDETPAQEAPADEGGMDDLDALLASFDDDQAEAPAEDGVDDELDALLKEL